MNLYLRYHTSCKSSFLRIAGRCAGLVVIVAATLLLSSCASGVRTRTNYTFPKSTTYQSKSELSDVERAKSFNPTPDDFCQVVDSIDRIRATPHGWTTLYKEPQLREFDKLPGRHELLIVGSGHRLPSAKGYIACGSAIIANWSGSFAGGLPREARPVKELSIVDFRRNNEGKIYVCLMVGEIHYPSEDDDAGPMLLVNDWPKLWIEIHGRGADTRALIVGIVNE